jgi:predicted nucleotide-binding protein
MASRPASSSGPPAVAVEGVPVSRPTLFVGSSSEGLKIAQVIQVNLDSVCEVKLWTQGVFGLTQGTLETLVMAVDEFDFAVLVLTADDLNISRGTTMPAARDNVLFELGLFIGSLGRNRTFILYNRAASPALPSDLAGVTAATFEPHADPNLEAALGAPCTKIQHVIERLGTRENKGVPNRQGATQNAAGSLSAPRDDSEVAYKEVVSGVVVGLPPRTEAWILVQPSFEGTYWPQRNLPLDQTGSFRAMAQFGRSTTTNIGEEFILLLVMAPPDASARFRDSQGLPELPPGVQTLARIIVTRRWPNSPISAAARKQS